MKDDLGDRMKSMEARETSRTLFQTLPIYARIDGRGFSRFTKGMEKPFSPKLLQIMIDVTEYLIKETHARVGYTQSDEISLLWQAADYTKDIFFKGKVQKMCSVLPSMAAAKMATLIHGWKPYDERLPAFDCRVLQLPNQDEAANMMLWRSLDGNRNAITMLAQSLYSHRELQGVNTRQMLDLIAAKDVVYDHVLPAFRHGTFVRRKTVAVGPKPVAVQWTTDVPDDGQIYRSRTVYDHVPLRSMTNRVGFLFENEVPSYASLAAQSELKDNQ